MTVFKFSRKKINKSNVIKLLIIIFLITLLITLMCLYIFNFSFRNFIDLKILHKEISNKNTYTIDLDSSFSGNIYAYDKYVVILDKSKLISYNSSASKVSELDINIDTPKFASNNRFLCVYENSGNLFYLISGSNILWQNTIDGSISKVSVNKNGYVSIIVSGTSYKSVVVTFDSKGNELFKTYLSSTLAVDSQISNDNKYLSIAEVDYSGLLVNSMIKTISIENAKTDASNSLVSTVNSNSNELIVSIAYQNKNTLSCLYDDCIKLIDIINGSSTDLLKVDKYSFSSVNLKNNVLYVENKSTSIFTSSTLVNIMNIDNNNLSTYTIENGIKDLYSSSEKIAINTGSEIHFIGINGWLIKIYNSSSEINNVVLADYIAGIVYKNRIELISL